MDPAIVPATQKSGTFTSAGVGPYTHVDDITASRWGMVAMVRPSREARPLWLDIALQPGTIEVLVTLRAHQRCLSLDELSDATTDAHLADRRRRETITRAVRRLGAAGLLRRHRTAAPGTWDELQADDDFELTERGDGYARTLDNIASWASLHLAAVKRR